MSSDERQAVVLLTIQGQTTTGQAWKDQGTGFFVSSTGIAITAAHLFYLKNDTSSPGNLANLPLPETPMVIGQIGSAGESIKLFEIMTIDATDDVAVVHLKDQNTTAHVRICGAALPQLNDKLYSPGFPGGQSLIISEGTRSGDQIGLRYPVSININPGMSGSPVFLGNDRVVAISEAGVRDGQFQGYNFVLPIQYAVPITTYHLAQDDCPALPASPTTSAPTAPRVPPSDQPPVVVTCRPTVSVPVQLHQFTHDAYGPTQRQWSVIIRPDNGCLIERAEFIPGVQNNIFGNRLTVSPDHRDAVLDFYLTSGPSSDQFIGTINGNVVLSQKGEQG